MQRKKTIYILVVALLIGVGLRWLAMVAEDGMSHDESISYLAASGNWGAYQEAVEGAEPYGSWVSASTWKVFLDPRPSLPFGSISADLARLDVHPPLYFWLLHVGMLVFGLHNWTGTAVNLLLFIPSTIALYFLARRLLKNEQEAAFVCLIWAASPALIDVTTEARQYELLGLAIILFVWAISSYADTTKPFRWSSWIALVVTTAVGLLSHYHFVLVLAGAGLFFLAKQMWTDRHRFLWGAGGIMVGAGLFLVAHPRFLDSFSLLADRQDQQINEYWTWLDLIRRIYAMGYTYTRFFVYGSWLQVALFCLFISSVLWVLVFFVKNRQTLMVRMQTMRAVDGVEVLYLYLWTMGWTSFLYLMVLSPLNAMTPRHMIIVWPFLAMLVPLLLRLQPTWRPFLWRLILGLVLISGAASVYARSVESNVSERLLETVPDRVVIDNVHEGILPRLVLNLPDETLVFAADQSFLLSNPDRWVPELQMDATDGVIYYVNNLAYANTTENRDALLQQMTMFIYEPVETAFGTIYRLGAE